MKTNNNFWNVTALASAYNKEVKGFNAQARFVFAHKDAQKKPIVEIPEGIDKKDPRYKEYKDAKTAATKYNNGIETAKAICENLNITAETIKAKNISELFKLAVSRCKNVTADGKAVKFVSMPNIVLENVAGAENYFQVKEMNTFELLAEAARTLDTDVKRIYTPTQAPTAGKDENGDVTTTPATGDIVNAQGQKLINKRLTELLNKWETLTEQNYKANKKGTRTAKEERANTMKPTTLKEKEETREAETIQPETTQPEQNTEQPKAEETKKTPKRTQVIKVA